MKVENAEDRAKEEERMARDCQYQDMVAELLRKEEDEDRNISRNASEAATRYAQKEREYWSHLEETSRSLAGRPASERPPNCQGTLEFRIMDIKIAYRVLAQRAWMVFDLKEALEAKAGIPRERQRLFFLDRELLDRDVLGTVIFGDIDDKVVDLVVTINLAEYCDYEFIASAVRRNWRELKFASPALRADRGIVRAAMLRNWEALKDAAPAACADEGLILLAVSQDGLAGLELAEHALRGKFTIVYAAVRNNWRALQYASPGLKADADIVLTALEQDVGCLRYAAAELTEDAGFMLSAVRLHGRALQYASSQLQSNFELVYTAVTQDRDALRYASDNLHRDDQILALVRGHEHEMPWLARQERTAQETLTFCEFWSGATLGAAPPGVKSWG